eukprot:358480-Chlamydomonas_euryale.AAC.8
MPAREVGSWACGQLVRPPCRFGSGTVGVRRGQSAAARMDHNEDETQLQGNSRAVFCATKVWRSASTTSSPTGGAAATAAATSAPRRSMSALAALTAAADARTTRLSSVRCCVRCATTAASAVPSGASFLKWLREPGKGCLLLLGLSAAFPPSPALPPVVARPTARAESRELGVSRNQATGWQKASQKKDRGVADGGSPRHRAGPWRGVKSPRWVRIYRQAEGWKGWCWGSLMTPGRLVVAFSSDVQQTTMQVVQPSSGPQKAPWRRSCFLLGKRRFKQKSGRLTHLNATRRSAMPIITPPSEPPIVAAGLLGSGEAAPDAPAAGLQARGSVALLPACKHGGAKCFVRSVALLPACKHGGGESWSEVWPCCRPASTGLVTAWSEVWLCCRPASTGMVTAWSGVALLPTCKHGGRCVALVPTAFAAAAAAAAAATAATAADAAVAAAAAAADAAAAAAGQGAAGACTVDMRKRGSTLGDRASPIVTAAESQRRERPQFWVCGS